jgi:hypothetical protein
LSKTAAEIRKASAEPIKRSEAQRMARYLVSVLVPRRSPGKKPTAEVLKAVELKQQGKPWFAIYPQVISDYDRMPKYERSWKCFKLRRAVAASLKRRRLRNCIRTSYKKKCQSV